MKLPSISAGLLLGFVLSVLCAHAQTESPAAVKAGSEGMAAVGTDQAKQIYAHAKPYMDDSLSELKRTVPALDGLKTDASQLNLQAILERTGEVLQAQVPKIPDLMARESVWQAQFTVPPQSQEGDQAGVGVISAGRGRGQLQYPIKYVIDEKELEEKLHSSLQMGAPWKDFDYMILSRQSPDGGPQLEESRTDTKARSTRRPEGEEQTILHGTGFGYMWLLFLPGNTFQSSYRFLGQQKMLGHEAYVVAFAQSPDRVKVPGEILFLGTNHPMLCQGIAWIDETTFRIVRLRTDLLAPLPSIQVQRLTSDLRFSEVRIPELDLPLWLPRQVELTWRQQDQLGGEMHLYTKYRLFHATARILPPS